MIDFEIISCSQSNELEFTINRVTKLDGGKYFCKAVNAFGTEQKEATIKVLSAPKVLTLPSKISAVENTKQTIECIVESHDNAEHEIYWVDFDGKTFRDVSWIGFKIFKH